MEAANGSAYSQTSSKTIVQFSDPDNLFDDVAPLLQNRLPLGNLHWKSPSRPLRSIEELDVSLEREQVKAADGISSTRRHQIPGLRQTPFVKVLLLRCDDKEKYRESVRRDVKEWVKSLGMSTSSKSTAKGSEKHDAYEYIILHVVLPGTPAATQPKSSKHISLEATESTDSVNSRSKWGGKSTSTVLDKLRADFASTSKAPFERVAQIRLTDPARPNTALSPLEIEEQWQDLVEKLKVAILQSFDARVAQYEEDIREREAQRSLPGWNFCTFFILKEGLARGFENVGLLEDALQIYEQLDVGLDAVIQDQAREDYADATNALLPYASDLKDVIRSILTEKTENDVKPIELSLQVWSNVESTRFPWKTERRNYQQMILTNQVSALDFRIYIFIRQMQILLRRAGTSALPTRSKVNRQGSQRWDADLLSEICQRSIRFMNLAARNLRQDLLAAWGGQEGLPVDELVTQKVAIENIVASWKWASCLQTLTESQIISSFSSLASRFNGDEKDGELFTLSHLTGSQIEQRVSISTTPSNETTTSSMNGTTPPATTDIFVGLEVAKGSKANLVFWAAELFTMMRTIFVQVCSWSGSLPIELRASGAESEESDSALKPDIGLRSPTLCSIVKNEKAILGAYKLLTVCACQCYTMAAKRRASRQLLFDLAKLEVYNKNYEAALSWLDAIDGLLDTPSRTSTEQAMLGLYIDCLRRVGRDRDLLQSLFTSLCSVHSSERPTMRIEETWKELLTVVEGLGQVEFPFEALFQIEKIDRHIRYLDQDSGSFCVCVGIRCRLPLAELGRGQAEVECRSSTQHVPATITFATTEIFRLEAGHIKLNLNTHTATKGRYDAALLRLTFHGLEFVKHLRAPSAQDNEDKAFETSPPPVSIYVYPGPHVPVIAASHAELVDLTQKRNVSIRVDPLHDQTRLTRLQLKPATAGLRLDMVSSFKIDGSDFKVERTNDAYVLVFDENLNSTTVLQIPYSFDDGTATSASMKAELTYSIDDQEYQLFDDLTFMTLLPISVNVQDMFQSDAIFSRFTFAPSRLVPISILQCDLSGSAGTKVVPPPQWTAPIDAFPKQPVSWVVQLMRDMSAEKAQSLLTVTYRCIDEIILETILQQFSQSLIGSLYGYASWSARSHLRSRLQTLWTQHELELATLSSEVDMWTYEELDWTTWLYTFAKEERSGLEKWLRRWHDTNSNISLRADLAPIHKLRLTVDPPFTQIVVTTELRPATMKSCIVGQPFPAQLIVSFQLHVKIDAEITAEVVGFSESWLVGGQRKITVSTGSEQRYEGRIILVAQRTGSLTLPAVDVKCRELKENGQNVAFEVDNLSSAAVAEVNSDVRSTTIAFGDNESAEGHWLTSSRQYG
ncbi:hypothetical protein LTR64_005150 [Lithohypha guttulata]|uniref:uncharacterized protein n=1 Tax=Lithohypha guttulata TaxID=1690604 RepID=UPI00315DC603